MRTDRCLAGAAALLVTMPMVAQEPSAAKRFADYWHQGKAEITRFKLEQSRYGQMREGDAIVIFVTEPFLAEAQVKSESGAAGAVPVLKLNMLERFVTGIYDYAMMLSVFSPEDLALRPHALKATASVQDWCGQVWQQLNLREGKYGMVLHSYFEKEADARSELPEVWLEDEIWNRIRMDPDNLPQGKLRMIAGLFDARLRHRQLAPQEVQATLRAVPQQRGSAPDRQGKGEVSQGALREYVLEYAEPARTLAIRFEDAFPHGIVSWVETTTEASKTHTTTAVATSTLLVDYWNENGNEFRGQREKLGIGK